MAAAYAAAMVEYQRSQTPDAPRIRDGNSLCRFWADEDPFAAEITAAVLIQDALTDDEVELLLATGVAAWEDGRRASVKSLRSALDGTAHDIAFSDEHVALYLHRDSHLQQAHPMLVRKLCARCALNPASGATWPRSTCAASSSTITQWAAAW